MAVAWRGWADGVGSVTVGASGQHVGAVRYVPWGGSSMCMGSVGALGVVSCVSVCRGGMGTAGACWRARTVWGMGKARGGL